MSSRPPPQDEEGSRKRPVPSSDGEEQGHAAKRPREDLSVLERLKRLERELALAQARAATEAQRADQAEQENQHLREQLRPTLQPLATAPRDRPLHNYPGVRFGRELGWPALDTRVSFAVQGANAVVAASALLDPDCDREVSFSALDRIVGRYPIVRYSRVDGATLDALATQAAEAYQQCKVRLVEDREAPLEKYFEVVLGNTLDRLAPELWRGMEQFYAFPNGNVSGRVEITLYAHVSDPRGRNNYARAVGMVEMKRDRSSGDGDHAQFFSELAACATMSFFGCVAGLLWRHDDALLALCDKSVGEIKLFRAGKEETYRALAAFVSLCRAIRDAHGDVVTAALVAQPPGPAPSSSAGVHSANEAGGGDAAGGGASSGPPPAPGGGDGGGAAPAEGLTEDNIVAHTYLSGRRDMDKQTREDWLQLRRGNEAHILASGGMAYAARWAAAHPAHVKT